MASHHRSLGPQAPPSALPSSPLRTRTPWLGPQRLPSLRRDSMPWRLHLGNEETDRSDIRRSPSSGVPDGTSVGESLKQSILVHSPALPEGGWRKHSAELPSSRPSSPCSSRPWPPAAVPDSPIVTNPPKAPFPRAAPCLKHLSYRASWCPRALPPRPNPKASSSGKASFSSLARRPVSGFSGHSRPAGLR